MNWLPPAVSTFAYNVDFVLTLITAISVVLCVLIPYKSTSLEWSMMSSPPTLNFDEIPIVTGPTYAYGTKQEVD
jgi:heme/copper-type cytochrome/quinol oxidase subunit 1